MTSALHQTYVDFSDEKSTSRIGVTPITAGNIVAVRANVATLQSAENSLTLGARTATKILADDVAIAAALPSDLNAQRERKWLVKYKTTGNNFYHYTIPAAAVHGATSNPLLLGNTDLADLSQAEWVAWTSAFVAVAIGPDGNGANAVVSAQLVGRAL